MSSPISFTAPHISLRSSQCYLQCGLAIVLQPQVVLAGVVAEACMKDVAPGDIPQGYDLAACGEQLATGECRIQLDEGTILHLAECTPVFDQLAAVAPETYHDAAKVLAPLAPDDRNVTLKGPGNHNHTALSGALLASATGLRRRGAMGGC